jgi:hypothetical protein
MEIHGAHGVPTVTGLEVDEVDVVIPVSRAEAQVPDPIPQHQMMLPPDHGLEYETTHAENL